MVYVDCRNATPGASGAGCQKSCHTLDMDCVSVPRHPRGPSAGLGHLLSGVCPPTV